MLDFLKQAIAPTVETETQTETKPENTTMTLKAQIIAFRNANPSLSVAEIAKHFKTSKPYVYQSINKYKKPKKVKSLAGKVEEKKVAAPTVNQLNNQIDFLNIRIQNLTSDVAELEAVVKALRLQNRGLSNVITYLESKLGLDEIEARLESKKD